MPQPPILIIPCSGMGKVHGLISREATYQLTDRLMSDRAETACLALLVSGDEQTCSQVRAQPCVTIDGCPKLCAKKNVELSGGQVGLSVRVFDALKQFRGKEIGSPTTLTDEGFAAADVIADEIAQAVRRWPMAPAAGREKE